MANTSISGLVSGLDTATIISQLMQLEAQPKTNLQSKVSTQQREITALQTFNAKLAAITTRAAELAKPATWNGVSATSSNAKVAVTADTGATPASLTFTVNQVATKSVLDLGVHALTDQVTGDGTTKVSFTQPDGTVAEVETGDGTVQGLVNALNRGTYGATATLVQVTDGSYRLSVTAATTGDASMALAATSGGPMNVTGTVTLGLEASITVGSDTITSDSNTFEDLMPGVDVTLAQGATGTATLDVVRDPAAMTDKVKSLVDTINAALAEAQSLTKYDAAAKKAGLLAGDSAVRGIGTRLLDTVIAGVGGQSLADLGIQSDRTGKLVFDDVKFKAAFSADPAGVAARFTAPANPETSVAGGMAVQLETLAKSYSNSTNGQVTKAIEGRTSLIDRLEDDIASWDLRLEQRRSNLERQYGALEVALGKLQSQSSWLAGQLNSLSSSGS